MLLFLPLLRCTLFEEELPDEPLDLPTQIETFIDKHINSTSGFACELSVNGAIKYSGVFGYSDMSTLTNLTIDDIHEWGEISSIITFVAVMKLVEEGRLNLEADICEYLGDDFFRRTPHKITLLNLMQHTSGWEDVIYSLYFSVYEDWMDLGSLLKIIEPLQVFTPGTYVAYSNYGVAIAGYIVEKTVGIPFHQYVRESIFNPLGMTHTTMDLKRADIPNFAEKMKTKFHTNTIPPRVAEVNFFMTLYPSGGTIGTLGDMGKWFRCMASTNNFCGLFKNPKTLQTLLSYSDNLPENTPRNAHGMWAHTYGNNLRSLEHMSSMYYSTANALIFPNEKMSFVLLSNMGKETYLTQGLPNELFGVMNTTDEDLTPNYEIYEYYINAKRSFSGPVHIIESWNYEKLEKRGEFDLSIDGTLLKQIEPNLFMIYDGGKPTQKLYYFDQERRRMVLRGGDLISSTFHHVTQARSAFGFLQAAGIMSVVVMVSILLQAIVKWCLFPQMLCCSIYGIVTLVGSFFMFMSYFLYVLCVGQSPTDTRIETVSSLVQGMSFTVIIACIIDIASIVVVIIGLIFNWDIRPSLRGEANPKDIKDENDFDIRPNFDFDMIDRQQTRNCCRITDVLLVIILTAGIWPLLVLFTTYRAFET